MEFPFIKIKAVKANYATRRGSITPDFPISDESEAAAEELAAYIGKDGSLVEVRFIPQQPPLLSLAPVTTEEVADEAGEDE